MTASITRLGALASAASLLASGASGASGASAVEGLVWRDCYDGLRCTEVSVPPDWARPAEGARITVPLLKIPATGDRLGSLVVNPGGPAASIPNFAFPGYREQFADLAARFDVVIFDPRGMNARCPSPNPPALASPLSETAHRDYTAANARFAADCAYPDRLNANQVAHDLDAIREQLGERKLDYFGSSYGTVYGQAYAERFGHRVGRMYLDSVLDHTTRDATDWARPGALTAERNLHRMARWCAENTGCALHGQDLLAVWDGIDEPLVTNWTAARIGDDKNWPAITTGLARAAAGDTSAMKPQQGPPDHRLSRTAFCADFPYPSDFPALRAVENRLRSDAPRVGWAAHSWRVSGHCSGVPRLAPNPPHALAPMPRVLVANGEDDPLTPAEHGRRVAAQLHGTYLPAAGHHALYLRGNACVRDHVHRYLWTGALPGTSCG